MGTKFQLRSAKRAYIYWYKARNVALADIGFDVDDEVKSQYESYRRLCNEYDGWDFRIIWVGKFYLTCGFIYFTNHGNKFMYCCPTYNQSFYL